MAPNEDFVYDRKIVRNITQFWLKVTPDKETFLKELIKCIADGSKSI